MREGRCSLDRHDKEIIDKLKQLPKVENHVDKDYLYEQIRTKLNRSSNVKEKLKSTNRKKIIPIFSTLLIIAIMIMILPTFINEMIYTNESKTSDLNESFDAEIDVEESSLETTESDDDFERGKTDDLTSNNSYVLRTINNEQTIVYSAIVEEQLQYVIPISFITQDKSDLSSVYNELDFYLQEDEWGSLDYLFKDVIFDMDLPNRQVMMSFPEDFSLGDGAALANVFGEMLSAMFQPYGIEKVVFADHYELDLGPYGMISELELHEPPLVNYKLFKHPNAERAFLTPIKQEGQSIVEALNDMKNAEQFYHVNQTIPDDVDFHVESSEQELLVYFSNDTILEDNQLYMTMIEAILMTAKSYGYQSVIFENTNIEWIGPYNITKTLNVPLAINPLPLSK